MQTNRRDSNGKVNEDSKHRPCAPHGFTGWHREDAIATVVAGVGNSVKLVVGKKVTNGAVVVVGVVNVGGMVGSVAK